MASQQDDMDAFLRSLSLFASIPAETVRRLRPFIIPQNFGPQQIIFQHGDPGEAIYFVRQGRVKIYTVSPEGDEMILGIMRRGDLFGGVVLFGRATYPATAQTMEPSLVASILTRRFHQLMDETPSLGTAVTQLIADRLQRFQRRLARHGVRDARYRLLATLCELAAEHGRGSPDDAAIILPLDLTHQELAAMIGTTRETVSRLMAQLRESGIILDQDDNLIIRTDELDDML